MNDPIGVIGLGDLGSQLVHHIIEAGFKVLGFDNDKSKTIIGNNIRIASSIQEVLAECAIIHWAVPSSQLPRLEALSAGTTLILHDSVMQNSVSALQARTDRSLVAIAHCLMNHEKRVFIARESSANQLAIRHFRKIGLRPKLIATQQHDGLMAHSQGVLAVLIELGLKAELDAASRAGDLTPSAEELHLVLINRESNWTPRTLNSILANAELQRLIEDMAQTLKTRATSPASRHPSSSPPARK